MILYYYIIYRSVIKNQFFIVNLHIFTNLIVKKKLMVKNNKKKTEYSLVPEGIELGISVFPECPSVFPVCH